MDFSVDDPFVEVAVLFTAVVDDRLQVVILLEVRIDVGFPVELLNDEIKTLIWAMAFCAVNSTAR